MGARVRQTEPQPRLSHHLGMVLLRSRSPAFPARFIEPCAPVLYEVAPAGPDWLHEIKHDGWRMIAPKAGEIVRLWSRNGRDWTADFAGIAAAVAHLPQENLVLDGEAVGHGPDGLPDFHALQGHAGRASAVLYAFDILVLDARDLRPQPLALRRDLLAETLADPLDGLRMSEAVEGEGATIFRYACALSLEGIISKRRKSPYRSGRDHAWRKIKFADYRRSRGDRNENPHRCPNSGGVFWCRLKDSNPRPTAYKAAALPAELNRHP